jgi:hypothetical protein
MVHLPVRKLAVSRVSAKLPIDPPHNEHLDRSIVGRIGGRAARLWRPVRFDGTAVTRLQMSGFGPRYGTHKKIVVTQKND